MEPDSFRSPFLLVAAGLVLLTLAGLTLFWVQILRTAPTENIQPGPETSASSGRASKLLAAPVVALYADVQNGVVGATLEPGEGLAGVSVSVSASEIARGPSGALRGVAQEAGTQLLRQATGLSAQGIGAMTQAAVGALSQRSPADIAQDILRLLPGFGEALQQATRHLFPSPETTEAQLNAFDIAGTVAGADTGTDAELNQFDIGGASGFLARDQELVEKSQELLDAEQSNVRLGEQCGGRIGSLPYPPGRTTSAACGGEPAVGSGTCFTDPQCFGSGFCFYDPELGCIVRSCLGKCNFRGYLWDSVTDECGCAD